MSIRGRKSLSNRQDEFRKSATKILESNKYVFERQKMLFYSAVSEQVLLLVCRDLTPKDYDVVVVERNSENLCGFPICGLSLEGTKGKVLGLKIKEKVYGLTGRKSFCSHRCFSESLYLQNQLCEEPLYARSRNR